MLSPVLVIEDDPRVASALASALDSASVCAVFSTNPHHATLIASQLAPVAIVVSYRLQRARGSRVVHNLRRHGCNAPIIALVARARDAQDASSSVPGAASDLHGVVHPVDPRSLATYLRRLVPSLHTDARSMSRDPSGASGGTTAIRDRSRCVSVGDYTVCLRTGVAHCVDGHVVLSPLELATLVALHGRAPATVPRELLESLLQGRGLRIDRQIVTTTVRRLRRKLRMGPLATVRIVTVTGMGYRLVVQASRHDPTASARTAGP